MAACYFIALLTNCPDAIIVDGLLPINTNIVYTIRDKFDNITTVEVTTDGDGKFTIDPALFPLGIFNEFAGTFELLVYANVQDATNLENQLGLTLCDVEYFSVVFCFTESEAAGAVIPNCDQEQPVDDNTDIPCVTNPIDAFCKSVRSCLGISATANIDLFLNRRGQWVEISGGGAVDSVNGQTGAVVLTKADIVLGNVDNTSDINKPVSTAQAAADTAVLNASKSYAESLVTGLLDDRGNYDASVNSFPSSGGSGASGAILKGDLWTVSVAGTLGGVAVTAGDVVRALTDSPGQTASNWAVSENNIGYVAENQANKTSTMAGNEASTSIYLSAKGVYDWATSVFTTTSAVASQIATALADYVTNSALASALAGKQNTLISGTNIKTVNGNSLLGSGDIIAGGSCAFISEATASNSAVIDFTLPTGYAYFELFIEHLIPQTNSTSLFLRVSVDGGATFLAGASDYEVHRNTLAGGGGTTYAPSFGLAAQIAPIGTLIGNTSGRFFRCSFRIFHPSNTTQNKNITGEFAMQGSDGQPALGNISARVFNTSAVNAIRLLMNSGNIASGVFKLYGYKS